jgi:hypothetical protein
MHRGSALLPKAVDIEWVEGASPDAYDIKEGEFVVRLDPSESQPKNISTLALIVVEKTTLLGIRSSLDNATRCAIDINLTRALLHELRKREVLEWFLANEYERVSHADAACERRCRQIRVLDERGLFTRVLLVELDDLAEKVYGLGPDHTVQQDAVRLVEFLHGLATKRPGQDVPLDLATAYLRIGIIIAGKTGTILTKGIEPYVATMKSLITRGCESAYLLIYDKEWLGAGCSHTPRVCQARFGSQERDADTNDGARGLLSGVCLGGSVWHKENGNLCEVRFSSLELYVP